MDPNMQDADKELIEAEETSNKAASLLAQGNEVEAAELEAEATDEREEAEQMRADSESQLNEELVRKRNS